MLLKGDIVGELKKLKAQDGPDLQVYGSGKRLFAEGAIPVAFTLDKSQITPHGVIVALYKRAGDVKTGSFA